MKRNKKSKRYEQDDDRTLSEDILDFVKVFLASALFILLFVHFVAAPVTVSGHSMVPTLQDGQYGFTNIIGLAFEKPQRFDVVVATVYDDESQQNEHWVKRVIGIPGDTVEGKNEKIYVNGKELDESSYISQDYRQKMIDKFGYFNMDFDKVTLGDNQYFLMGDNRPYSKDSRYKDVGPISADQFYGKGVFVLWPFNEIGAR